MLFLRVSVVALVVMTLVTRFDRGAAINCLICKSTDDGNCSEGPDKIDSIECKSAPASGTSIAPITDTTDTTAEETSGKDTATPTGTTVKETTERATETPTVTTEEEEEEEETDVTEGDTLTPTVTTVEETTDSDTETPIVTTEEEKTDVTEGDTLTPTGTTVEETTDSDTETPIVTTEEEKDVTEGDTATPAGTTVEETTAESDTETWTVTTEEENTTEKAASTAAEDADDFPEDEPEENRLGKVNPEVRQIFSRFRRNVAPLLSRADGESVCYKLVYSKNDEEIVERGCALRGDNTCDKLRQEEGKDAAACYVCDNEDGCNASSTISLGIISLVVSIGLVGIFGR